MPRKYKIVAADAYAVNPGDLSWKPLEELGRFEAYADTDPSELGRVCADADALLINRLKVRAAELDMMPQLKYIGTFSTGTNTIDLDACRARGIEVRNIPAYSTASVAQMTWALILELCSAPAWFNSLSHAGMWSGMEGFDYHDFSPVELAGSRIGIVGMGNIGSAVAGIARAFGMEVVAFSSKSAGQLPDYVTKVSLDELCATSHVVSIHCPLTPATRHMIDRRLIDSMMPEAILVNTARGAVVDEQALADALHRGSLRGAAVDVLSTEPPAPDFPLLHAPRCIVTPHVAWATRQARSRAIAFAAQNLKSALL